MPDDATPSPPAKRSKRDRLIGAFKTAPRSSDSAGAGWSALAEPPPAPADDAQGEPDAPPAAPITPDGVGGQGASARSRPRPDDPTGEVVVEPAGRPSYPPVFEPSGRRATAEPPDESQRPGDGDPARVGQVEADREPRRADLAAQATGANADVAAPPIDIVGLHGGQWYGRTAEAALRAADVLIGHARQLAVLPSGLPGKPVELWGNLDEVLGFAAERQGAGQRACVLAAGDPGFFGLVRLAAARLGEDALRVHPAPSSVALAFARVGANWDDALVVSAHGRPLEHAVAAALDHPKVAVLVSKDQPPQALGQALVEAGCGDRTVAVCSRLGESDEQVVQTDLAGLAAGTFDALSVVLVQAPVGARPADRGMGLRWGRSEADFAHRDGMVTKAEVRAVALGKLGLPPVGTLWDVGAGSGSVAIECARLAPGLRVYAVERRPDDVERIRANAHGSGLRVVAGTAPDALADLPDPDRAFVGGGGLAVLDAVRERLRPGGVIVATYATLATAAAAADRLGNVVQVQVSRGVPVGTTGQLRLAAENPVFVVWGPT